ncbi:MAG TPA: FAD-dependent oxidoreductase [Usitatibacter sp.]|nr:FAD-dependent oxidoreductase [Usitatibacter sp.]
MSAADTIVIGAGPAGIGAALALGDEALVLERSAHAGGLSATVTLEGAVFDLGGHSFHTPHTHVRDLVFGAVPMEERRREAWCYVNGEWIPYPFQQHFESLHDAALVEDCREGLRRAGGGGGARNFDEHIESRFGPGIAKHFMRPYNEKLWGRDLTRLEASWTSERVAPSSAGQSMGDGGKRAPLRSDERVAYPARGGFGEIFDALAKRVSRMRYGETVARIEPGYVVTGSGERISCRHVISTMPLPSLLAVVPGVPAPLRASVNRLAALPLALVMIALDGQLESRRQRAYNADPGFPGHKIALNHNSSSYLEALPRHGILVEVSGANAIPSDDATLAASVIRGLEGMGLLERARRVTATRVVRVPLGYPVPTHSRAAIVDEARTWLRERGIETVGRFGEWAYINSDEALHRGLRAGEAIRAAR